MLGGQFSVVIHRRIIVCLILAFLASRSTGHSRTRVELGREILSHYNKSVAPGFENVPVSDVGIVLSSARISDLDESTGTLSLEAILLFNWMDSRLRWNDDASYKNISWIMLSQNDIWKPRMNAFKSGRAVQYRNEDLPVYCTMMGMLLWRVMATLHPVCDAQDLGWYPNDVHNCTLSLGSLYPQDVGFFIVGGWEPSKMRHEVRRIRELQHPHWDLVNLDQNFGFVALADVMFYPLDMYVITVRRQGWPLLVAFLPLMVSCVFLSWSSFALPLDGKRLTKRLSVATLSLFLSSVLLLLFVNEVPGTGLRQPIIVQVSVCFVFLELSACLHTVIVANISRKPTEQLKVLRKLPESLQYLLGIHKFRASGDGILENMESPPESGREQFLKESSPESNASNLLVATAYDRTHLILQLIFLPLAVLFLCLV